MRHEKAGRNASKKQLDLGKALVHLKAAFASDAARDPLSISPQALDAARKIDWHVNHVCECGFIDSETVNERLGSLRAFIKYPFAKRVKMFEQCEKAAQNLIKRLVHDSESAKAAAALLDVIAACKKDARP
jgi:hypothetical protein